MWCRYERMNIIRFLSSVGRNLRMGRMLGRHSVKSRIESEAGLSLTEFTYQAALCSTQYFYFTLASLSGVPGLRLAPPSTDQGVQDTGGPNRRL